MKMKHLKLIIPALLSIACLSGCDDAPQRKRYIYTLPKNEEVTGTYYKSFDFEKTGPRMINQIHAFMFEKHTTWVQYKDFGYYCQKSAKNDSTDAIAKGSNKIQYLYTGKEMNSSSYGTREHVWPCANSGELWTHNPEDGDHYVDGTGYVGGGSDLYHVRPSDSRVNSARGNSKFVDFYDFPDKKKNVTEVGDGGPYKLKVYGSDSTGQFANRCEPADEMKGDIARILAYVYVHYARIGSLDEKYQKFCGSLSLTQVLDYGTEEDCREVLCKWNEYDPPSEVEKLRNDTVQKIQGNRNPFVDYPGLIERMFGYEQEVK